MLDRVYHTFFGGDVLVAPEYLLVWALLALAVYLWRRETVGFIGWLLPRAIWRHRSTRADLGLFAIGRLMALFGIVSRFVATPVVAATVAEALPASVLGSGALSPVVLALVFFVTTNFATYWAHRAHHTIGTLWPLHAVHHSAAVLTPFTAYRQHPLSILVTVSFQSVVVGTLLGVLVGVLDPEASFAKIAGANAFIVLANLTVSNFHHAHIWISFGPVLERIVMSPAQHQIHHSTDPAHFNRNYGNVLALWDWMFRTLYITGAQEQVRFGLDSEADAPLMTHRLWPILWTPLRRMFGPPPPAR
jgi:sterol desaturase/sphingolipid hydroxylase (fatty acid hydroxylase superfamily)